MSVQKGRDLLLKYRENSDDDYQPVAGLRSTQLSFNAASVDVTNADSAGRWRELLSGAGVRSLRVAGAGIFRDDSVDTKIKTLFFDATIGDWQIIIPDFGAVTGIFQIVSLDYRGSHDGEMTYNIALESAGDLTFTPA